MNGKERSTAALQDLAEPTVTFAGFRLEPDGTLFRGPSIVHLPARELAALRMLLAHAGQIVTPQHLLQELWGGVHVSADSVPKCLSSLRARLAPEECIQTVYKRGYRFSAQVRHQHASAADVLPRLAIMPFEAGSGFPAHLGLGVVEETIDRLVNLRPAVVSVLARDSVFALARDSRTALAIGQELNADYVLTGTLRALPAHYRLRASMIRVEDGAEIWVEDLLVERDQIGALESELVGRVAFRLGSKLVSISAAAQPPRAEVEPQRLEAYHSYLKSRFQCQTLERHRLQDGFQQLLRATEIDPSLTTAQVDLAHLCCVQAFYGFMSPAVAAQNIRRAAQAIPEYTTHAEMAMPAVGWISYHVDRDLRTAIDSFSRSSGLPYDSRFSRLRVMFALSRHRFDEAIELMHVALREDPFSPLLQARMAWALHLAGRGEESLNQIRRAFQLFPTYEWVSVYGSIIASASGEAAWGLQLAEELAQRHPYFDIATATHAYALARSGRGGEASALLERLQWLSRERFVLRSFTAAVYVALADSRSALAELQMSDESRCPWFFQMLADPRLRPLEQSPEFAAMKAMHAAMEQDAIAVS